MNCTKQALDKGISVQHTFITLSQFQKLYLPNPARKLLVAVYALLFITKMSRIPIVKKKYKKNKSNDTIDVTVITPPKNDIERNSKIQLLNQVSYEFVCGALHYGLDISPNVVMQFAQKVKKRLEIKDFDTDTAWLRNFQANFQIPKLNIENLKETLEVKLKNPPPSLHYDDLIDYVKRKKSQNAPENNSKDNNSKDTISAESSETSSVEIDFDTAKYHMKCLVDYALANDNFRAIAMISQLGEQLRFN